MVRRLRSLILPLLVLTACQSGDPLSSVGPLTGTYNYTKTEGAFLLGGLGQYEVLVPETREIWIGHDGSGRLRTVFDDPIFFGERDRAEWEANPPEWAGARTEDETKTKDFSFIDVSGLPTEPDALRAQMQTGVAADDRGSGPPAWEIFVAAHGMLWETVPSVALSKAVLAVLSATPGIEVLPGDFDQAGRDAIRFSVTSPDESFRSTMWLDPESGALLAEEEVLLTATPSIDAEPPVVIKRATYVASKMVHTTTDR